MWFLTLLKKILKFLKFKAFNFCLINLLKFEELYELEIFILTEFKGI